MLVAPKAHPELKFRANSGSPLKWTKTLIECSSEHFCYEPGNSFPGGLNRSDMTQNIGRTSFRNAISRLCVNLDRPTAPHQHRGRLSLARLPDRRKDLQSQNHRLRRSLRQIDWHDYRYSEAFQHSPYQIDWHHH